MKDFSFETTKLNRFRGWPKRFISDDCFTFIHDFCDVRFTCSCSTYLNDCETLLSKRPYRSDGFVWVEHNSDVGTNSASSDVGSELNSDHTGSSVGVHNFTPLNSISGVVSDVLNLENIGNSLSHVPFGVGLGFAVLDFDQSLVFPLMASGSSETGEDSLLV